jgi:hypothetical protein
VRNTTSDVKPGRPARTGVPLISVSFFPVLGPRISAAAAMSIRQVPDCAGVPVHGRVSALRRVFGRDQLTAAVVLRGVLGSSVSA